MLRTGPRSGRPSRGDVAAKMKHERQTLGTTPSSRGGSGRIRRLSTARAPARLIGQNDIGDF